MLRQTARLCPQKLFIEIKRDALAYIPAERFNRAAHILRPVATFSPFACTGSATLTAARRKRHASRLFSFHNQKFREHPLLHRFQDGGIPFLPHLCLEVLLSKRYRKGNFRPVKQKRSIGIPHLFHREIKGRAGPDHAIVSALLTASEKFFYIYTCSNIFPNADFLLKGFGPDFCIHPVGIHCMSPFSLPLITLAEKQECSYRVRLSFCLWHRTVLNQFGIRRMGIHSSACRISTCSNAGP